MHREEIKLATNPRTRWRQKTILRFCSLRYGILVLCCLLSCLSAPALNVFASSNENGRKDTEVIVSNLQELTKAIASVKPGDTIIMKDGIWHNAVIDFNADASPSAPVTLRAQTPGNVILDGNSQLTFSRPNLNVDGLYFKQGAIEKGSVVNFNADGCRLTNTAIVDYNPAQFETNYYWVYFKGNHNRLDHCYLKGKSNLGPTIGNDEVNSKHNTLDHCHIKDIPYVANANGREIMRIWGYGHNDEMGEDGAYFTAEYNLFERAHGEGVEIVSLKSNYNMVRYNTVRASRGGLVGRRGKNNTFEGNFILGEKQEGTTGIRVAGPNHRVVNNYVCDVAEDGLRLITGEYYEKSLTPSLKPKKKDLPKYLQVRDGYFAHNTIINAGKNGIDIGFSYKNQWPDVQMVLLPENNRFVNNLVYQSGKNAITMAVQDRNPPLDFLTFKPNSFEGNIVFGGDVDLKPIPSGIKSIDPKLVPDRDGLYRLSKGSPAINGGAGSDVKDDMDGQVRDGKKDVGADEFSKAKLIRHPLTANEVGPDWVVKKRNAGDKW
jgi:poly(beta-D-mannuronate) lyase